MKLHNLRDYKDLKPCGELTKRSRLFTGYGCNIKCQFCFYKDEKHKDIKNLIYQQLEQGKRYGILDWDISGGEPSILSYWFDLLKDMKDMGFRSIACITNGYRFSDTDFMMKSVAAGMNEILFSVHGSRSTVHDFMTGVDGSFEHIERALDEAHKSPNLKIRINIVVTKDNYQDLYKIVLMVLKYHPVAINFLPFRIENSADKVNAIKYSDIAVQINKAIIRIEDYNNINENKVKIAIRYMPPCLFPHLEFKKYCAGYLQRVFDEYEWDEYTIRKFENARFNKDIPELDCETDKWKLQIDALNKSIKHVAGHTTDCLKCKYIKVCDGIWKSYAKIWCTDEFKPIEGKKTENICW
jgi:MoaA/NifB/PqqE/SkfB family radical SAM enzyme